MENHYKTLLALVTLLIALGLLLDKTFLVYLSLAMAVTGLLSETITTLISTTYLSIVKLIGRINGVILLSLIFFVLIVPYNIVLRLLNKGLLKQKMKMDSSGKPVQASWFSPEDLEHPF